MLLGFRIHMEEMTIVKKKFLIVTASPDISHAIQCHYKEDSTTELCYETSLSQALDHIMRESYCLLMVDLQLSEMNKIELVRIFNTVKHFPILAITVPLDSNEKVALFRAGVDAFLEKPLNIEICSAQADALIKLYLNTDDEVSKYDIITLGASIIISPRYRQVFVDGERLSLTRKEFDLLYFFAKHPGQVFSRSQLYTQVWDNFYELGGDETVKAHIKKLRKKLSMLDTNPIENVRGVGYRFIPPI